MRAKVALIVAQAVAVPIATEDSAVHGRGAAAHGLSGAPHGRSGGRPVGRERWQANTMAGTPSKKSGKLPGPSVALHVSSGDAPEPSGERLSRTVDALGPPVPAPGSAVPVSGLAGHSPGPLG